MNLIIFLFSSIKRFKRGLKRCPRMKGSINFKKISTKELKKSIWKSSDFTEMKKLTKKGDKNTPKILESEAAQIAAETFPPEDEVKITEDCTVEGKKHKNKKPVRISGFKIVSGRSFKRSPNTGKNTKVRNTTSKCSLKFLIPCTIAV